jgi:hypothetical protein
MSHGKFKIGDAYYHAGIVSREAAPWAVSSQVAIETFVYQGYFRLDHNSMSCDLPHHFYVFQPFIPFENVLSRSPKSGLKVPSLRQAEETKRTLEEVIGDLKDLCAGPTEVQGLDGENADRIQ